MDLIKGIDPDQRSQTRYTATMQLPGASEQWQMDLVAQMASASHLTRPGAEGALLSI